MAAAWHIELRFLPVATPALHAMDHLWRQVKGGGLAHRATVSIDTSAGMGRVTEDVVWAKMKAMAEGAKIASERLGLH